MNQQQYNEIERVICSKLNGGLTRPVGNLESISRDFLRKVKLAIKMKQNLTFFIRGGAQSGKKLMVHDALRQINNLTVVNIMGTKNESEVFSQIANQLHPLKNDGMPRTWTEKNHWMLTLVRREIQRKRTVVLVIDRFEQMVEIKRQQFLYTLINEMQQSTFRGIIVVGLSRDCSIQQSLEKRTASRISLVNFEINRPTKAQTMALLKEHFCINAPDRDEVPSCPDSLIERYNTLTKLRLQGMMEEDAAKSFQWCPGGGSPIEPYIDSCYPMKRLLNGTHPVKPLHERIEFYGNIDNLSHSALELGIALCKLHSRNPDVQIITFAKAMREIKQLFEDSNYIGWKSTRQYDHEFQYMLAKGIVSRAPMASNFSIMPDMPVPRNIVPVQLECLNLFRRYIEDLKNNAPCMPMKNNPLKDLPTVAQRWARSM